MGSWEGKFDKLKMLRASKDYLLPSIFGLITRDGILGHQFNKKLESFAPRFSGGL
jgi:hypothetical protein